MVTLTRLSKPFTALVVDCEGAFPAIVRDFPTLLDGIRVIYVEQDGEASTVVIVVALWSYCGDSVFIAVALW